MVVPLYRLRELDREVWVLDDNREGIKVEDVETGTAKTVRKGFYANPSIDHSGMKIQNLTRTRGLPGVRRFLAIAQHTQNHHEIGSTSSARTTGTNPSRRDCDATGSFEKRTEEAGKGGSHGRAEERTASI